MLHRPFTLLTIDLSMFGEGAAATAAPAGEGLAPAAALSREGTREAGARSDSAAPEVRYGKQPEQTAAPQQQTQTTETPDKGKLFKELIKGEYKDQYTEATQQLINRRFKETDQRIQSMQPIIDLLDQRYGTGGDMTKLMGAIESDRAYWQEAADTAGMTVEQYQAMQKLESQNRQLRAAQQSQQQQFMARVQYQKWEQEAETLKQKYPDFDLAAATENDMFRYLLKSGNYPMEAAYEAAFAGELAARAAANAQKAVTDNIRARGNRPKEAGAAATPAFTVKDDVSKLSDEDVRNVLAQIGNGRKVTFG